MLTGHSEEGHPLPARRQEWSRSYICTKKKKKSFSSSRQRKNRYCLTGFPRGSVVKNLPVRQEAWVRSLSPEAPPEERTATHSTVLAWRIPWTEEPGGLHSLGS